MCSPFRSMGMRADTQVAPYEALLLCFAMFLLCLL